MSVEKKNIFLPGGETKEVKPELPEGVARVDTLSIVRTIHEDGSMNLGLKVDSTDERVLQFINSFELAGLLASAQTIVLNTGLAKG